MLFNLKDKVEEKLNSYKDFYEMMFVRSQLDGRGKLTTFVVLGRYCTDSYGRCMRLNREIFTDEDRKAMPSVMTMGEFEEFFISEVKPRIGDERLRIYESVQGASLPFPLPNPRFVCAGCGGGWTLDNCHDIDNEGGFEEIDLSPFVGKTLREAQQEVLERTDAMRDFYKLAIKNPKWVDTNVPDRRECQRGWRDEETKDVTISLDYVVQPNDSTQVHTYRFYHGSCFRQYREECLAQQNVQMKELMKDMFEGAGFKDVHITSNKLPQHMRDWMMLVDGVLEDSDKEMYEKMCDQVKYDRVDTEQGSFGVMHGASGEAYLDLDGTGVTLRELGPYVEGMPFVPMTGEEDQLLRLWQLLTKAKTI